MTTSITRWLLASVLVGATLPAQQPRASRLDGASYTPLPRPEVEFDEAFTNITAVRELRDARVLAVDPRDKVVQLIDFRSGTLRKVGREGSGPREYGLPLALLALPGDSSAIYDPLNSRFMLILPNGEAGDFFTLPTTTSARGPGGGMMMIGMTPPRYTDARGRFYVTGAGVSMGPDGPVMAESLAILRIDRATKTTDTLGFLRLPKDNATASGGSGNFSVRIGTGNPFAPRDDWAVTPDGRVAIIRSPEYRIDWVTPVRRTGTPIPYERVKVTEGHKQQWRDAQRNRTVMAVTMQNGRRSVSSGGPGSGIDLPDPGNWPEYLPAFAGQAAVLQAPNGQFWVQRSREARDDVPKYDVFDATGKVAMRVALAPKTRVVGFGNGVVYTIRTDEDDLQYLQRIRLP
jgi:hypothetical protein